MGRKYPLPARPDQAPRERGVDPYTDYRPVADAIRTMVVRGAPPSVAAAYAYCLAALDRCEGWTEAKETLAASRPTVNLFWALDRMDARQSRRRRGRTAIAEAKAIHAEGRHVPSHGGPTGRRWCRSTPHPHPLQRRGHSLGGFGTALGVIRAAHEAGKVDMVYCDETRPLLQAPASPPGSWDPDIPPP